MLTSTTHRLREKLKVFQPLDHTTRNVHKDNTMPTRLNTSIHEHNTCIARSECAHEPTRPNMVQPEDNAMLM